MYNPPKENDTHYIVTNTAGKIESPFSGPREDVLWKMIDGKLDGKLPIMTNIDPSRIVRYDGSVMRCTNSTHNMNIRWGDDEYPVVILDDHGILVTCHVHESDELTEEEIKDIDYFYAHPEEHKTSTLSELLAELHSSDKPSE